MDDGDIREVIKPYIMGRIVDVEQFFENYKCDEDAENTRIAFEVTDDFLKWNNRTFTVDFNNGKCTIIKESADFHVKTSIATLTTLLIGYKTAAQLLRMERIEADSDTIDRLDDVLMHEQPYISDYI